MCVLAALLTALVAGCLAEISSDVLTADVNASKRSYKSIGAGRLPAGCLFEGRWLGAGAAVATGEACLQCACRLGALACRRRACAPLPDPPPRRCHVLHRRGACCPELHCPDGVILMEHGASARFESDDEIAVPVSITHACVEGGTIYAAGSAMKSSVACEQCFCLGGARRCVRPRCLPPPPGCRPRAAPGACCPQRYYCEHRTTKPPEERHPHDCKIDNKWINEGDRVMSSERESNCTQCFCLRGSVQCHTLSCAPPLLGCKPLLRPGECCAHQYQCEHKYQGQSAIDISSNSLISTRNDDRALHTSKSSKQETTTKNTPANIFTVKNTPHLSAISNHLISTTKVKRKTSDPPPEISSQTLSQNTATTEFTTTTITTPTPTTLAKLISTSETSTTTELSTESTSTEQPEESVRIVINGTINCTAELSSTSLPLNVSVNETQKIALDSQPRIPLIDVSNLEDNTFSPNDIITDRTVNGGFDENESFVINVTSSLNANKSHSSTRAPGPNVTRISATTAVVEATNSSKKTKGDYDYDYTEPTLPPSLPNLKIIPFVAADAVVEDDQIKEPLGYPALEREDKFPVYYPTADTKDSVYPSRREDVYRATQYPVFITDKPDQEQYPSLTHDVDLTSSGYSNLDSSANQFTAPASIGDKVSDTNKVTLPPMTISTVKLETPAVNLFSPPVQTEGGFVPKGPTGLIDEYFAVFPSTPSVPSVPHLTTSMQLDVGKGDCSSADGRQVPEGETITVACSECTCAWGTLHCSPRPCLSPPNCQRRPASNNAADLCCGELICDEDYQTSPPILEGTMAKNVTTEKADVTNITNTDSPDPESSVVTPFNFTVKNDTLTKLSATSTISSTFSAPVNTTANNISTTIPEAMLTKAITTTTPDYKEAILNNNHSLEYEDDEDEGFSFGSVLKLLLSENYETTTAAPKRAPTSSKPPPPVKVTATSRRPRPTTSTIQPPKRTVGPFIPMPQNPYMPSKKNQNPINRIDHLVLGEATAIKKTTPRPTPTTFRYVTTPRPTTQKIVTKQTETKKEETYTTQETPRPPGGLPGLGPGLLKLAGCNIYGRMYRVGRIIAELSTPCQECWCTEFGVQCKQLKC